jgi:DNA helicase-2/ATP-dependent DNA helicase PcrA
MDWVREDGLFGAWATAGAATVAAVGIAVDTVEAGLADEDWGPPLTDDDSWADAEPELPYDPYPEFPDAAFDDDPEDIVIRPTFTDVTTALAALPTDDRVTDLFGGLNQAQFDAVRALIGPVLVVAGPGSGKTRVLTHRVAALARLGVPAWQIMAVTFTNKAAGEMRERIATLVGEDVAQDMWVSTFHSACVRILRRFHDVAGLPRAFTILDSSDVNRVIKALLVEEGVAAENGAIREIATGISRAKNTGLTPEALGLSVRPQDRATAGYFRRYQERLTQMGAVDFDDLLVLAVRVLEQHAPALTWVRRRARYLLVDEVQDTNSVQVALLRLICPPGSAGGPGGPHTITQLLREATGNMCLIGDTDQAIYGFRAADPVGLLAFWAEFQAGQVVVLEQNYRSTQAILEVVRAIIAPNPALHRPKLFTTNGTGTPVRLYLAEDDRDEADWVLQQIRHTGGRLDDHAVLFRTNAQTRVFEEALTKAGLAYQVIGALKFYDRAEIKDALSYLRVAVNPADAVNLARCINTPRRGIGDATVSALVTAARDAGVDPINYLRAGLSTGSFPKRAMVALAGFLAVYDAVQQACADGPVAALRVVAETAGLRTELLKDKQSGIDRVENLDELIRSAESFLTGPSSTSTEGAVVGDLPGWEQTLAYLENVALVSAVDLDEESATIARVSLLTAHASKGKEFPHVYVVGVEDGLYPHERSQGDDAAVEEERRLLFVACSRAEQTLTLSRCEQRYMFNRPQTNPPSPFLDDLPSSVQTVESTRPSTRWGAAGTGRGAGYAGSNRPGSSNPVRPGGGSTTARYSAGTFYGSSTPRTLPASSTTRPVLGRPAGPRLTPEQCPPQTQVRHSVFGVGTVLSVSQGKAEILFGASKKTLDLSLAPLTLA